MYSRITASSRPTVETKEPASQEDLANEISLPFSVHTGDVSLNEPDHCDTAYFGGIEINMCTWAGCRCPCSIRLSFCPASNAISKNRLKGLMLRAVSAAVSLCRSPSPVSVGCLLYQGCRSGACRDHESIRQVQPAYWPLRGIFAILERPCSRCVDGSGCTDFRCLDPAGGLGHCRLYGPGPYWVLASRPEVRTRSRNARDTVNHHRTLDLDP